MRRGEIWRCDAHLAERGNKPGYYVIASRDFIAASPRIATVIAAPIYSERLGLQTEVMVGPDNGIPKLSAVRGDLLTSVLKDSLSRRMGELNAEQLDELNEALAIALALP